jgi:hypothetical protein
MDRSSSVGVVGCVGFCSEGRIQAKKALVGVVFYPVLRWDTSFLVAFGPTTGLEGQLFRAMRLFPWPDNPLDSFR